MKRLAAYIFLFIFCALLFIFPTHSYSQVSLRNCGNGISFDELFNKKYADNDGVRKNERGRNFDGDIDKKIPISFKYSTTTPFHEVRISVSSQLFQYVNDWNNDSNPSDFTMYDGKFSGNHNQSTNGTTFAIKFREPGGDSAEGIASSQDCVLDKDHSYDKLWLKRANETTFDVIIPYNIAREGSTNDDWIPGFRPGEDCDIILYTRQNDGSEYYDQLCEEEDNDLRFAEGNLEDAQILPPDACETQNIVIGGKVNYYGKVCAYGNSENDAICKRSNDYGVFAIGDFPVESAARISENKRRITFKYYNKLGNLATQTREFNIVSECQDPPVGKMGGICELMEFESRSALEEEEVNGLELPGTTIYRDQSNGSITALVCQEGAPQFVPLSGSPSGCRCLPETWTEAYAGKAVLPLELCNRINNQEERSKCKSCLGAKGGIWSGFGCIAIGDITTMLVGLLQFAAGVGGGITFLLIVYGGFIYLTSQGNPEKIAQGKEIIAHAIAGLLLILFSAVILKIIGVDILRIPGFV